MRVHVAEVGAFHMRLEEVAPIIKSAVLMITGAELSDAEASRLALIILLPSFAITFGLIAWRIILWVRRKLGDDEAISDDQAAMVRLIAKDLQGVKKSVDDFGERLNSTIGSQLGTIAEKIDATAANTNVDPAQDVEGEKKGVRLFYAERVRDAVMQKFLGGAHFAELARRRHEFTFDGTTLSGVPINILLLTPYRQSKGGRADFVLIVRSSQHVLLDFEWSYETTQESKVARLARDRTWVEEIVAWNFETAVGDEAHRQVAAAE